MTGPGGMFPWAQMLQKWVWKAKINAVLKGGERLDAITEMKVIEDKSPSGWKKLLGKLLLCFVEKQSQRSAVREGLVLAA